LLLLGIDQIRQQVLDLTAQVRVGFQQQFLELLEFENFIGEEEMVPLQGENVDHVKELETDHFPSVINASDLMIFVPVGSAAEEAFDAIGVDGDGIGFQKSDFLAVETPDGKEKYCEHGEEDQPPPQVQGTGVEDVQAVALSEDEEKIAASIVLVGVFEVHGTTS
jgi:hypothetical protein